MKTEFGFDVMQVARGRYALTNYHDFIGFKVSKPVLERAFKVTYAIEMKDLFADEGQEKAFLAASCCSCLRRA